MTASAIVPLAVALVAREWVVAAVAALALGLLALARWPAALDGPQHAGAERAAARSWSCDEPALGGGADAREILRLVRDYVATSSACRSSRPTRWRDWTTRGPPAAAGRVRSGRARVRARA